MIKALEDLVKELNNGRTFGATISISKMLNISDVSVHNWFVGKSVPSEENIKKIAKKTKRKFEDVQKIFVENANINSYNKNSFNSDNKKEIELKDKEIELLKKEIELLKKEIQILKK